MVIFFSCICSREVTLGEHTVGVDPDCFSREFCAPRVIKIEVDKVIIHEKYDRFKITDYDIALIRLKKPVPLFHENPKKSFVEPVCLPKKVRQIEDGSDTRVTGWGFTLDSNINYENTIVPSTKLRVADVPIMNKAKCVEVWADKKGLRIEDPSRLICAGNEDGKYIIYNSKVLAKITHFQVFGPV